MVSEARQELFAAVLSKRCRADDNIVAVQKTKTALVLLLFLVKGSRSLQITIITL